MKKLEHPLSTISKYVIKNKDVLHERILSHNYPRPNDIFMLFIVDISKSEVTNVFDTEIEFNYFYDGIGYDIYEKSFYQNDIGQILLVNQVLCENGYHLCFNNPVRHSELDLFYTTLVGYFVILNLQISSERKHLLNYHWDMYQIESPIIEEKVVFSRDPKLKGSAYRRM